MKNPLFLSALVMLAGLSGCLSSEEELEAFPTFSLADHETTTHNNSMYSGSPYVAYFSASWCSHCTPTLDAVVDAVLCHAGRGVAGPRRLRVAAVPRRVGGAGPGGGGAALGRAGRAADVGHVDGEGRRGVADEVGALPGGPARPERRRALVLVP